MSGFYFMVGIVCFAVVGLVIAYHVIKSAVRNGIKESGLINVKTTYEELRFSWLALTPRWIADCLARASSCHMVYRPDRLLALTVMVGPFLSSLEYEFGRFCRFRNAITNACVMALVMPQTKN